jgi:mycoredoxin-dependent peroxiredoxin
MAIEVGDLAPDFELRDNHGRTVRLSGFRSGSHGRGSDGGSGGKGGDGKNTVLFFYPYAFSSTCTGELQELRDALPAFVNDDTQLLAVSCDSIHTLRVFAEQEGIEFPLLADHWPHGEVARAYGVLDERRGCALRGTFVMDRAGVVRWSVLNPLSEPRNVDDCLRALKAL